MLLVNFSQTNAGAQSAGYSVPDESYYPYSPASISSNGSSPSWVGQNVNSTVYLGEQVQVPITMNNSPVVTMPMSPVQGQAPIPTIISMDETLPSCAMANVQPANVQPGDVQPAPASPAKQGAKAKKIPGVKRARTAYSSRQLATLEEGFCRDPYVTRNQRIYLSVTLHLTEKQIKIWYQNRRMKLKKESPTKSIPASKSKKAKKAAVTTRRARRARQSSTCSSTNSQATNSPPPFDAHRASMMTPPQEMMPMMQLPRANCVYEDMNNYQRSRDSWMPNGEAVNAFPLQQQPLQWQNADASYGALPMAWNSQQFSDVNNNAQQYDAAYYQGPSTSGTSSSSNNQRSAPVPNILMDGYQLPVLGDLSAWLENPQEPLFNPNFMNL